MKYQERIYIAISYIVSILLFFFFLNWINNDENRLRDNSMLEDIIQAVHIESIEGADEEIVTFKLLKSKARLSIVTDRSNLNGVDFKVFTNDSVFKSPYSDEIVIFHNNKSIKYKLIASNDKPNFFQNYFLVILFIVLSLPLFPILSPRIHSCIVRCADCIIAKFRR